MKQAYNLSLLKQSVIGYSHHKVVVDNENRVVDYIFLETNKTFELFTGLKSNEIVNKSIKEVIVDIEQDQIDWIKIYGEVALKGKNISFESFSESLNRWYKVFAFSEQYGYFTTLFTHLSNVKQDELMMISEKLLNMTIENLDYQLFTDTMLTLTDAKFALFSQYDSRSKKLITKAMSGDLDLIKHSESTLNLNIIGSEWDYDFALNKSIRNSVTTILPSLTTLTQNLLPPELTNLIEKNNDIGDVVLLNINKGNRILGDFTLFMPKETKFNNNSYAEVFSRQVGQLLARLEVEEKLVISEDMYQSLVESQNEMICRYKPDGTITYVNEAYCRAFGKSRQELIGLNIHELTPVEERDGIRNHLKLVKEKGQASFYEHSAILANGQKVWQQWGDKPIFDKEGRLIEYVSVGRDITERKLQEDKKDLAIALLTSLNRGDDLTEILKDVLRMIKENTGAEAVGIRLQKGNSYPYFLTNGLPEHFIKNEHKLCVFTEENKHTENSYNTPIMKFMCGRVLSRKFNPHKPYFTKKGSFWTNSSSLLTESLSPEKRPLPNQRRCAMENYESIALIPLVSKDNIIGLIQLCDRKKDMLSLDLIEFLEDVGASIGVALSKRKMVEALEASEAKIQSIFRGAPAGIGVLIDRCLVDANKYLCDLTGFTEKELLHQPSIFIFPNEEEYLRVSTELTRQVNEKGTGNIETKFKCKDGTTKDIFLNVATLNSVQDISRITFSAIDVTEQKEIERILNQTQKMDTIGKFAGGIAHDYNNMMTVILNYLDLVECEPDLTPTFRSYLDKIRKAAQHSAIITRQLLGFARNQTINPIVIDLNKAVGDMCSMMRSLILENIKLEWNPENNLWPVKIDPVQVDQIVANLLVNAQEAIVGSGVISISTSNCSLDVKPHKNNAKAPNGDFVVLKITDNGVGMSEKVREQLFIPFFSTKDIGKNTGLGLATVYGIVKQNKGFIKVESGPEAGTTFSIYFPKTSSKLLPVVKQKTNIDQTGDETILLIDDENSILEVIQPLLERYGYTVLTTTMPSKALSYLNDPTKNIDLVITDVIMPEMNGQELHNKMLEINPNIKCLFMSGYTDDLISKKTLAEKNVYFVQKPISAKNLASKIREILDSE